MQKIIIHRTFENEYQTLGELKLYSPKKEIFRCKTLELPWRNNKVRVSRIPTAWYEAIKHISPRFGKCVWIQNVPNRSEILIHAGNYYTDILGCILVGRDFVDIDGDGNRDVTSSRDTMDELMELVDDELEVIILNTIYE